MNSLFRGPCALALAFVLGGCAPALSAPSAAAGPAEVTLPAAFTPAAIHKHCAVTPATRLACYDAAFLAILKNDGVSAAMRALDEAGKIDGEVVRDGHMYAHSIGLETYTTPETLTPTFRACTPAYQSGCYHGVIQAYFAKAIGEGDVDAIPAATIDGICRDNRGLPEGDWMLFQCVHGIGHGLSQLARYDLKRALAGCDKLESDWEREVCYAGAFMENATQAFAPHHTVGRPDAPAQSAHAHAGHAGMDHTNANTGTAPPPKLVDPADLLYPCSVLDERYLSSCYGMQTSVMLNLNNWDFAGTARTCDTAPQAYRLTCYQSLGRDVSSFVVRDFTRAAALCATGDAELQPACHVGYVKNVIDVDADHRSGLPYCTSLTRDQDRAACYRAVGEQIQILLPREADRVAACGAVSPPYRNTCLTGAAVATGDRRS